MKRQLYTLLLISLLVGCDSILSSLPTCFNITISKTSNQTEEICLDKSGLCQLRNADRFLGTQRCEYFGECCSTNNLFDRLDVDTYSCQGGVYVIDRCPKDYENSEIRKLCEKKDLTTWDYLSSAGWPAQGTTSGLLYKNVFCAICNDVELKWFDSSNKSSTNALYIGFTYYKPTVDWPLAIIRTKNSTESQLRLSFREQMTSDKLEVYYILEYNAYACSNAVNYCPDNSGEQLRELCQYGPAYYVTNNRNYKYDKNHTIYHNNFCARCHGEVQFWPYLTDTENNPEKTNSKQLLSHDSLNHQQLAVDEWEIHGRETTLDQLINNATTIIKMVLEEHSNSNKALLVSKFRSFTHETCSAKECIPRKWIATDHGFLSDLIPRSTVWPYNTRESVWFLGSYECYSRDNDICNHFIVMASESEECQELGCPSNSVPNLQNQTCHRLPHENKDSRKQTTPDWQFKFMCNYLSSCQVPEQNRTCKCDNSCIYYNDCCVDAPYISTRQDYRITGETACLGIFKQDDEGFSWGYQEVIGCPADYHDTSVVEKCTDRTPFDEFSTYRVPVSDRRTGIKFANVYCALCNGVEDPVYWKHTFSCINYRDDDNCLQFGAFGTGEIKDILHDLSHNVSTETLIRHKEWCEMTYQAPEGLEPRKCRSDSDLIINNCPPGADPQLAYKCQNEPTSFVWDHLPVRRYRNSYCGACHGLKFPGCELSQHLTSGNKLSEEQNNKKMFIYEIDYNERACRFDSEFYLTFPIPASGRDICVIQDEMRSCGCNTTFDLTTQSCVKSGYQHKCSNYESSQPQPSKYLDSAKCRENNFTYTPQEPENIEECSQCQTCGSQVDAALIEQSNEQFPVNAYCVALTEYFPRCKQHKDEYFQLPRIEGPGLIDNSSFKEITLPPPPPAAYVFSLNCWREYPDSNFKPVLATGIDSTVVDLFHLTFRGARLDNRYTLVKPEWCELGEIQIRPTSILICPNNGIKIRGENETNASTLNSDFYLAKQHVCVSGQLYEKDDPNYFMSISSHRIIPKFVQYILLGLSMLTILIYIVIYVFGKKRSFPQTFFCCLISNLFLALLFYCFMGLAAKDRTTCTAVAVLVQYFFLSIQTWTNAFAFQIYRSVSRCKLVSQSSRKLILKYAAYAWGLPLVIVIVTLIMHFYTEFEFLKPIYVRDVGLEIDGPTTCFVGSFNSQLIFFLVPTYTLMLANVAICICIMVRLRQSVEMTLNDKKRFQKHIFTCFKLVIVLGSYWLLIFLLYIPGKLAQEIIITMLYIILELQGVVVVLVYSVRLSHIVKIKQRFSSTTSSDLAKASSNKSTASPSMNLIEKKLNINDTDNKQPSAKLVHQTEHK